MSDDSATRKAISVKIYWSWRSYPELRGLSREEQRRIFSLTTQRLGRSLKLRLCFLLFFAVIVAFSVIGGVIGFALAGYGGVLMIVCPVAILCYVPFKQIIVDPMFRECIRDLLKELEEADQPDPP